LLKQLHIALAQPSLVAKFQFDARLERRGRLQNALAKRIKKRGDLTRQMDGNLELSPQLQITGRDIWLVSQGLGHAEDSRARQRVNAWPTVQSPVHCPDGNAERLRYVLDAGGISNIRRATIFGISQEVFLFNYA
jgi:hypothetical protein